MSKKISAKQFGTFIGILIGCEFTVIAILLSSKDILNIAQLDFNFILSILWLAISIFSCFETVIGYINYLRNEKEKFYNYGSAFYYLGFYSFYLSIIHLIMYVKLFFIALIAYYFLFLKIIFWTRVLGLRILRLCNLIKERKQKKKGLENNIIKRRIYFQNIFTIINIGLLIASVFFFYFIYFPWVGVKIYEQISLDFGVILYWLSYFIIWISIIGIAIIYTLFFKINKSPPKVNVK